MVASSGRRDRRWRVLLVWWCGGLVGVAPFKAATPPSWASPAQGSAVSREPRWARPAVDAGLEGVFLSSLEPRAPTPEPSSPFDDDDEEVAKHEKAWRDEWASDTFQWYILNCYTGKEASVAGHLSEAIDQRGLGPEVAEIVVPFEQVATVRGKKVRHKAKIVFPGYVFVRIKMSKPLWSLLTRAPRVINFVGHDPGRRNGLGDIVPGYRGDAVPVALSDDEAARMLSIVARQAEITDGIVGEFDLGDTVAIVDGPLAGERGLVRSVKDNAIIVALIGGGGTKDFSVPCEAASVRKLRDDEIRKLREIAEQPTSARKLELKAQVRDARIAFTQSQDAELRARREKKKKQQQDKLRRAEDETRDASSRNAAPRLSRWEARAALDARRDEQSYASSRGAPARSADADDDLLRALLSDADDDAAAAVGTTAAFDADDDDDDDLSFLDDLLASTADDELDAAPRPADELDLDDLLASGRAHEDAAAAPEEKTTKAPSSGAAFFDETSPRAAAFAQPPRAAPPSEAPRRRRASSPTGPVDDDFFGDLWADDRTDTNARRADDARAPPPRPRRQRTNDAPPPSPQYSSMTGRAAAQDDDELLRILGGLASASQDAPSRSPRQDRGGVSVGEEDAGSVYAEEGAGGDDDDLAAVLDDLFGPSAKTPSSAEDDDDPRGLAGSSSSAGGSSFDDVLLSLSDDDDDDDILDALEADLLADNVADPVPEHKARDRDPLFDDDYDDEPDPLFDDDDVQTAPAAPAPASSSTGTAADDDPLFDPLFDEPPPSEEPRRAPTTLVVDYAAHTVPELKALLKDRGLKVSGRKADLVARLEEADAAANPPRR